MKKGVVKAIVSVLLVVVITIDALPLTALAQTVVWMEPNKVNTNFKQSTSMNEWEEIERQTEVILRTPNAYEEIEASDLKGAEVGHDEVSRTYLLEDGTYLTRYYDEPIMYADENGELQNIDNSLLKSGSNYVNAENSYLVTMPQNGEGISIENKGYTLQLIPRFGELVNAVAEGNSIRYNNVTDGVDLQYTATGSSVKEDIILNKPIENIDFSYEIICADLELLVVDGALYAYERENTDPIFVITAPYMTDNAGIVSQAVTVSLEKEENQKLLTVTLDNEWLQEEGRAYPVIIDPVIQLDHSNLEYGFVENGVGTNQYHAGPDVQHKSNPYMYVGFERGNLTGLTGLSYGQTHSYLKINYDFSQIPDYANITAYLKGYKYSGRPEEGTKVYAAIITSEWGDSKKTWNTQPEYSIFGEAQDVSLSDKWVTWDITTAVQEWRNNPESNYGIMLVPESEAQGAVCFSGPGNSHGQQAMYFDISWTVENSVDEELALDAPVINLRPLTQTHSSGLQTLNGVFADGIVRPTLDVEYRLNDVDNGIYVNAEYGKLYPNSDEFKNIIEFTLGYVQMFDSNWQSKLFQNFEYNTLYNVYAVATNGSNTTPEGKSDSFIVYQFTEQDTLPYVADFYGVSIEQIVADNRPHDYLGFEGNTFFIRNPQKNADIAYSRPDEMSDEQKREIIYANLGRGLHSEFDLDPVNVNIGNYYFESIDAISSEYNGEFALSRSYNSIGTKSYGVFGRGWSFAYAEKLSGRADGSMTYTMSDGKQLIIEKNGEVFESPSGYFLTLEKHTDEEGINTYYTITDSNGTVRKFNGYGLLESITDNKGFATTIQYDEKYHISGIVTASGRQYSISTNEAGQIVSVILPNGGTLKYEYENGNLVNYTDADGIVIRYVYNEYDQMIEWYDGNGNRVINNEYDEQGRIIKQTDVMGSFSTLSYQEGKTVVTDETGHQVMYYYDEQYRTVGVEGSDNDKSASYNDNNELASCIEKGIEIAYEYDIYGNITKKVRTDGAYQEITYDSCGNALTIRDYDGTVINNVYDNNGNLITTTKADGAVITYTYDQYGQVTSLTDGNGTTTTFVYEGLDKMTMTDGNGNVTTYYYDSMGHLINEVDSYGNENKTIYSKQGRKQGTWKTGDVYEQYLYDGNGNCVKVIDPEGYASTFTYDANNNMLTATNPLGGIVSYSYDNKGNKISETDTLGNVTSYSYDENNRLVESVNAAGQKIKNTYDENGYLILMQNSDGTRTEYEYDAVLGLPVRVTDNTGTVRYAYDNMGRMVQTVDKDGYTTSMAYDSNGNLISATEKNGLKYNYIWNLNGQLLEQSDSAGGKNTYTYDNMGNLLTKTNVLGQIESYTYDAASRMTSKTDANGGTTTYSYDVMGNVSSITDANGVVTQFTYDKCGNMTSQTDGNGNTTRYCYDGLGNLLAEIDALGNTVTYSYNNAQNLISETTPTANTTSYEYNNIGQVVKVTDPDGYVSLMKYDANGNMTQIISPNGAVTEYTYNSLGKIVKIQTADGLVTEYEYDGMGRVVKEWDNAGNSTEKTYDVSGNVLTQTDAIGRIAQYTYDLRGNVVSIKDYNGEETTYTYDSLSNMVSMTDANGRTIVYEYDALGNLISQTDADGVTYTYEYDALSQLIREINPLNEVTSYTYDNVGNLIEETDAAGNKTIYTYSQINTVTSVIDANGNTEQYLYDADGRVIEYITAEGNATEYLYDGRGNVIKEKNPLGHVTEYKYDALSNLTEMISPEGASTKYTFNNAGLLLSVTDAEGNVTEKEYANDGKLSKEISKNGLVYSYEYDRLGRVVSVSDSVGYKTNLTYDAKGNLISEIDQNGDEIAYTYDSRNQLISVTEANGSETKYEYDSRGNLITMISPSGANTVYTYDILDRVISVEQELKAKITYTYDELGQTLKISEGDKNVSTTYDAVGNVTEIVNALGDKFVYTYDKENRVVAVTDYNKNSTTMQYDGIDNVTALTDALGNTIAFAYDGDSNITSMTDALGNTVQYRYDMIGNMTAVKTAAGNITKYTYDSQGNPVSRVTADGNRTEYEYDLHGNLVSITAPDGTVEKFTYDVESRLTEAIKPDGSVIKYDYDSLNNLLAKNYSDDTEEVVYGYDSLGNRITMEDEGGKTSYTYDVLGRVTSVTDVNDHTVKYTYDEYGRITDIMYPEDRVVSYTYDLADNLLKVEDSQGDTTSYTHDANGNVLTCVRSSGIVTEYEYNALGQVISIVNQTETEVLSSFDYTYDANGRIETERAVQDSNISEKEFSYDEDGQLDSYVEVLNGEKTVTKYGYSANGNRMAVTKGDDKESTIFEYNDNGQLVKKVNDDGVTEYKYDENGNLIEKSSDDEILTYAYDVESRLTCVHEGGTLLMAASYDGDGNRTFQIVREIETLPVVNKEDVSENPVNGTVQSTGISNNTGVTPDSGDRADNPSNSTEPLPESELNRQDEVVSYYEQIYVDPADSIFWYGFGQSAVQFLSNMNTAMGAYLSDWLCNAWDYVTEQYELILHSEVVYSEQDLEDMRAAGLSEEEIADITGAEINEEDCVVKEVEDKKNPSSSMRYAQLNDTDTVMIPDTIEEATRVNYDLTYYVNDINTANTQVLMTYGNSENQKSAYIYGNTRISEDDLQMEETSEYLYDGRGSVVQTVVEEEIELSILYDPYGEIVSEIDENFVGFAYNGEEYSQVTGLQYLRARYYDTELGSFLTIDSYLGSVNDTLSQNRYTYANNDPVNNIDPSGHYSTNINGANQYYQSTGLNELRNYMTAAALWAGEADAQNEYNASVAKASNTSYDEYDSISSVAQSTADTYIQSGISRAENVSINYGCSQASVTNVAIQKFKETVYQGMASANSQITALIAGKIEQSQAGTVRNVYNPWNELRRPGEIHDYVVKRVALDHGLQTEVEITTGRLDLWKAVGSLFWEVKPISYKNDVKRSAKLDEQITRYMSGRVVRTGQPLTPGPSLGNRDYNYVGGINGEEYKIKVYSEVPVKIFYRFYREEKIKQPDPVYKYAEVPEREKEKQTANVLNERAATDLIGDVARDSVIITDGIGSQQSSSKTNGLSTPDKNESNDESNDDLKVAAAVVVAVVAVAVIAIVAAPVIVPVITTAVSSAAAAITTAVTAVTSALTFFSNFAFA